MGGGWGWGWERSAVVAVDVVSVFEGKCIAIGTIWAEKGFFFLNIEKVFMAETAFDEGDFVFKFEFFERF